MNDLAAYDSLLGQPYAYGCRVGPRLWVRLFLAYLVCGYFCWEELQFQAHSVDVPGTLQVIGKHPKQGNLCRYEFRSPEDGRLRQNTVYLPECRIPGDRQVIVQWIGGDSPRSRLAIQASRFRITLFCTATLILTVTGAAVIGYYAWEANRRPLTIQQRAVLAYQKKKLQASRPHHRSTLMSRRLQ